MKPLLLRILRSGLPAAAFLGFAGYVMGGMAGMWLGADAGARDTGEWVDTRAELVSRFQTRLPVALATWGFGLVVLFEVALYLVRGNPKPAAPPPPPEPSADELLARAMRDAPPPCPAPPPPDNTPTAGPTPPG